MSAMSVVLFPWLLRNTKTPSVSLCYHQRGCTRTIKHLQALHTQAFIYRSLNIIVVIPNRKEELWILTVDWSLRRSTKVHKVQIL